MRLAAADHRLARWEELLDELTPRQVTTLLAFERVEKWGEEREDNRKAVEIASVCTAVSMSGKAVDPQKILEVLRPKHRPDDGYTSPDHVARMMGKAKPKAKPSGDRR
jgi:hypothetical protein